MYASQPINNPYQWYLLYDFSLPIGGTIVPTYPGDFLITGDMFIVDSVSTIVLPNGQTRKYMELQGTYCRLKWIDGIGDIERGLLFSADFEGGHSYFVCTSDTSGVVYERPQHPYVCSPVNALPGNGPNNCGNFNYNTTVTPRTCTCNGSIQITNLTGGTAPYSFSWNNISGNSSVTGLCSGNTLLTITDSAGITCSQSYYIGYNPLVVTISNTADQCSYTDTLCTNISGGTPPYSYAWNPLTSSDSCLIVNVVSPYFCYITDANGCTITAVNSTNLSTTPLYYVPTIQQASCATCCNGSIDIDFFGGTPPYTITYPNGSWPQPGNFCAGTYYYCVTDSAGCGWCDSLNISFTTNNQQEAILPFSNITLNQTEGILNINNPDPRNNIEFTLFEISGRKLFAKELMPGNNTVPLSENMTSGLYIYTLVLPDGNQFTGKWCLIK
jgi:hypothetical protein